MQLNLDNSDLNLLGQALGNNISSLQALVSKLNAQLQEQMPAPVPEVEPEHQVDEASGD